MVSIPMTLSSENPLSSLYPGLASELGAASSFLGALLLATIFSTMLYGLSVHQTYRYFQAFSNDIGLLKGLVILLFALDTVHTAFSVDACYFYLITNYLNPIGIQVFQISLKVFVPITGCTTTLAQLFYVRRVYLFGAAHRLALVTAIMLMLAKIGFVMVTSIKAFEAEYLQSFLSFSRIGSSGSFGCDLSTDTILTTALVVPLLRSRTGFRRTDSIIESLILYTVNTGLATSITGILVFIFSLTLPHSFVYAAISIVSNKVYVNAVMAVLNSRQALSSRMGCEVDTPRAEDHRGKSSPPRDTTINSWFVLRRSRFSVSLPGRRTDTTVETVAEEASQGTTTEDHSSEQICG